MKLFVFYNWKEKVGRGEEEQEEEDTESIIAKVARFHCKVRQVIKSEKYIATNLYRTDNSGELFYTKWEKFTDIYQIYGPDNLEVIY